MSEENKQRWARIIATLTLASLIASTPATASTGLICEGPETAATINLSSLPVAGVLGADIRIGPHSFSTRPKHGASALLAVGQAFAENDRLMIDFVDPNFEAVVGRLRLKWHWDDEFWRGRLTLGQKTVQLECSVG